MRQAMKIMKEQAAAMAVQAQQQAQEAAAQKMDAEATLAAANAELAEERRMSADLQVVSCNSVSWLTALLQSQPVACPFINSATQRGLTRVICRPSFNRLCLDSTRQGRRCNSCAPSWQQQLSSRYS